LRSAGDEATQWLEFVSLRGQYEQALLFVAQRTFTPIDGVLTDMSDSWASGIRDVHADES